ncbi:unnamed protein product, partial [marine sediment metagenome]
SSIKIVAVHEDKVTFDFVERRTKALPLHFWMFDLALKHLKANKDKFIMLGARVKPPFDDDTIEGKIWKEPYPHSSPYKVSPHICDYLVLSGVAKYRKEPNPKTGRAVQGIKYTGIRFSPSIETIPEDIIIGSDADERSNFINKFKQTIIEWAEINRYRIPENRLIYN